jgi:hypothetical protein
MSAMQRRAKIAWVILVALLISTVAGGLGAYYFSVASVSDDRRRDRELVTEFVSQGYALFEDGKELDSAMAFVAAQILLDKWQGEPWSGHANQQRYVESYWPSDFTLATVRIYFPSAVRVSDDRVELEYPDIYAVLAQAYLGRDPFFPDTVYLDPISDDVVERFRDLCLCMIFQFGEIEGTFAKHPDEMSNIFPDAVPGAVSIVGWDVAETDSLINKYQGYLAVNWSNRELGLYQVRLELGSEDGVSWDLVTREVEFSDRPVSRERRERAVVSIDFLLAVVDLSRCQTVDVASTR